ncbi:hypothetical protein K502DRAFT_313744 [Neoconidiobolus thromboides FSU 785]|nr:hypothetical protein K502DRAFT_313744 [Neoconidiobolus thromboides FSU 785]
MSSEFVQRGRTLRRGKTLNRPDRFAAPTPMLGEKDRSRFDGWVIFSQIVTFWAPSFILRRLGFPTPDVIQAWREKVTLCFIIMLICGLVVFLTFFLPKVFCDDATRKQLGSQQNYKLYPVHPQSGNGPTYPGYYIINKFIYNAPNAKFPPDFPTFEREIQFPDITSYFKPTENQFDECDKVQSKLNGKIYNAVNNYKHCATNNGLTKRCMFNSIDQVADEFNLQKYQVDGQDVMAGFSWNDIYKNIVVVDGAVLDFGAYFEVYDKDIYNDDLDMAIRQAVRLASSVDATKIFFRDPDIKNTIPCLKQKFGTGYLQKAQVGCFAVDMFMTVSLIVILSIIITRFAMAFVFHWFISYRLSKRPYNNSRRPLITNNQAPWGVKGTPRRISDDPNELFNIMLVTCYSEGEASMRTTIESLAGTDYSDDKKLLFIVADGIIVGSGNDKSTPDICLDLIELDPNFTDPEPQSYIAVAAGHKQHNRAKVYAGHFNYKSHRVPTLVIIKCGNAEEDGKPKAGNRGKRDSQLILMNFFSRVIYNERMTPLDYDLFRKIHHLMGVTPDNFETVLMVDADTKVYPDSLKLLTYCLINDPLIMGLCGETKIANKRDSWVTGIQVFEYYISHHLGKGFESVFGGVTCLPGCFCMYRLKAPKGDSDWVPIITKPEIVQEYSQNVVETLHQKNLLLLGEDRFLTTLMLRNFPNRKMMFVPQAICKTVVPDEFSVLLSQRRRWINSTIHNLLELVLVRNLCGTFCFSMQFVIFMELIGTVVLPVAIVMTFVLIGTIATSTINSLATSLPLVMLLLVLFSPALLILITSRKIIYVLWMFVYLLALPVWNFILPVYSYWHFDDFSWGATRVVQGEGKGGDHSAKEGDFDASKVSLRRWEDYERRRRRSVRRRERAAKEEKETEDAYYNQNSDDELMDRPEPYYYYDDNESNSGRSHSPDIGPQQTNYQYGSGVGSAIGNSYSNDSNNNEFEQHSPTHMPQPPNYPEQPDDHGRDRPMGPRPFQ